MYFKTCEVCGIKSGRNKNEKRLFMAKFPLDEIRCKQWVKAVGKEDLAFVPIEKLHMLRHICGKHFKPTDFKKKKTRLEENAIPTLSLVRQPLTDEALEDFPLYVAKENITRKLNIGSPYIIYKEHNYCQWSTSEKERLHNKESEEMVVHDVYVNDYEDPDLRCKDRGLALTNEDNYAQNHNLYASMGLVPSNTYTGDLPVIEMISAPSLEPECVMMPLIVETEQCHLQSDAQELDPDLKEILDKDPKYGSEIQKDLAITLKHIATSGLSEENRRKLKERYMVPVNCKSIKAPTLNSEVLASLTESEIQRDKDIESKQVLASCALSSLSEAITHLFSSGYKDLKIFKMLLDTVRSLADIQYMDSSSRRLYILSTLKDDLKEHLEKTEINEMLFGNISTDMLQSAKTIK